MSKFLPQNKTMKIKPYIRIGNLIPKHSLTVVTGLSGTGKSFTITKFLNQEGIEPIIFNLDEDPTLLQFKHKGMSANPKWLEEFMNGTIEDIDNEVIIIDTYSRFISLLELDNTEKQQKEITKKFLELCKDKGYTIIVIGHTEDYATKTSVFRDNPSLIRDSHEHIHFDKVTSTGRDLKPDIYRTRFNKFRGNSGSNVLENWLR